MSITIALALQQGQSRLSSETSRLDAELLLAHILKQPRTYLFTWPDKTLSLEQEHQFESLLQRREQGQPVAYLLGKQGFWAFDLEVNASTLIPRADTELLVEQALAKLSVTTPSRALDLGTGTGAIALAIAYERPLCQVLAVDKEQDAVLLAQRNAERLALGDDRIVVMHSDWFATVEGVFDLIVSNPPYIDAADPHLNQGDVQFEPRSALVSEKEGLADLTMIIDQARTYLKPGAWLMLEHGYQQAESVQALMLAHGYRDVLSHRDLGGNWRVTLGCMA